MRVLIVLFLLVAFARASVISMTDRCRDKASLSIHYLRAEKPAVPGTQMCMLCGTVGYSMCNVSAITLMRLNHTGRGIAGRTLTAHYIHSPRAHPLM